MKIIQLCVALNNEGEESLYALDDEGRVYQRNHSTFPPRSGMPVRYGPMVFYAGRTEGWIELDNSISMTSRHPDDPFGKESA